MDISNILTNITNIFTDVRISNQVFAILIFLLVSYIGVIIIAKKRIRKEAFTKKFYQNSVSQINNIIETIEKDEKEMSYIQKIDRMLKQARSPLNVQLYIVILIVSILGIVFASYKILDSLLLSIPIGFVGILIPRYIVSNQRSKFMEKFDHEMIKALRRMASVLRAGGSLENALKDVTESTTVPELVRNEFKKVLVTYKGGFSIQEAFYELYKSIGSPDTLYLCVAIDIQMEIGGDKAEIFDNVAKTISNRNLKNKNVQAKLKEIEVSTKILTFMPIPFAIMIYIYNPHHFDYFKASIGGRLLGFGIIAFMIAGYFINRKLSKVE